jgi:hypothetical protein
LSTVAFEAENGYNGAIKNDGGGSLSIYSLRTTASNSFLSLGCVTLTQYGLAYLNIHDSWVSEKLGLSEKTIKKTREIISTLSSIVIPILFFKSSKITLYQFLKQNPLVIAPSILGLIISTFHISLNISVATQERLGVYTGLWRPTSENYASFEWDFTSLRHHALSPIGFKELLFRGVVQEIGLKQLPRYIFHIQGISSAARIVLSGLIFGIAHTSDHVSYNYDLNTNALSLLPILETALHGMSYAGLSESLGFAPSYIAHYGHRLYRLFQNNDASLWPYP